MEKLLTKYEQERTIKSAQAVVKYANKHPMVECMMSSARLIVLQSAIDAVAIHNYRNA